MRFRLWAGVGAAVVAGVMGAQPAFAHPGHSRCAEGAHATVVAFAHSGLAGEIASSLAKAGTINESVATTHAARCDDRNSPP